MLFYILTVAFAPVLGVPITGDDVMKFLVTFPFSMLYGLVFLSLGLLVSTLIKRPKNALITSVFLFVFFGFLLSIIAGVVAFAVAGCHQFPTFRRTPQTELKGASRADPRYQE